MSFIHVLQGYVLGISVGSSIGVSGFLCLQNMMTGHLSIGLMSALAAALADMSCGVLVVFGLQSIQDVLIAYKFIISIIAGMFLCFLGLKKVFSKFIVTQEHSASVNAVTAVASVYFLSVVDPVSIADFMAMSIGLTLDFSLFHETAQFVAGLFLGSATWWFSLCCILMFFRQSISVETLQRVQQVVGAGIFGLGLWTIFAVLRI